MIKTCQQCYYFDQDTFSEDFGYCRYSGMDVKNNNLCSEFSDKSLSPCRHTLEDGADTTTDK